MNKICDFNGKIDLVSMMIFLRFKPFKVKNNSSYYLDWPLRSEAVADCDLISERHDRNLLEISFDFNSLRKNINVCYHSRV